MLISQENTLAQSITSYLAANIATGAGTIPVKNTNAFTANYAVQMGKTGEERAEIGLIASISGTAVVFSGTAKFDHSVDNPLYQIHYDKMIVKRSTTGTAGTATALATVSITPDSLFTDTVDGIGAVEEF